MKHIRVIDLEKTQRYRDRNPPWIKAYRADLADIRFTRLSESARYQLHALRLIAAETDNWTPFDKQWLSVRMAVETLRILELQKAGFVALLDVRPRPEELNANEAWMTLLEVWRSIPEYAPGRNTPEGDPWEVLSERTRVALRAIGGKDRLEAGLQNKRELSIARTDFIRAWGK